MLAAMIETLFGTPRFLGLHRGRHVGTVVARWCLGLLVARAAVAGGEATFDVTEVRPGVFVHEGRHVGLTDPGRDDIANVGFIVGERCVAVIDPGGSVENGRRLAAAVRARTDLPVCYVFLTHVHFDHVLGASAFVREGDRDAPEVIGHEHLKVAIEANRAFFAENFAAELGDDPELARVVAPTRTIADEARFDLGGRTLIARAHGTAHTDADLSVLDTATGTLFAGDLVFRERIPVLDGSVLGWLDELAELEAVGPAYVVPGHGTPADDYGVATDDLVRYLTALRDGAREAVAEGLFIEDAKDVVAADERARWLLFEENHRRNVSRAFRELEWE